MYDDKLTLLEEHFPEALSAISLVLRGRANFILLLFLRLVLSVVAFIV